MNRFAVTGLFADGVRGFGKFGTHAKARKEAERVVGEGAQRVVITFITERHVETISPTSKKEG